MMDPTKFVLTVGFFLALAFEAAYGISCYSCTSTADGCRKENFNKYRAPKRAGCTMCTVLYAVEPPNYVVRTCRRDPADSYKEECKESVITPGEKRCFCKSDDCNGSEMDAKARKGSTGSDTGTNTGTKRPPSLAVSWKISGQIITGLMLLTKIFI